VGFKESAEQAYGFGPAVKNGYARDVKQVLLMIEYKKKKCQRTRELTGNGNGKLGKYLCFK